MVEVSRFLDDVTAWAEEHPDLVGLALVGSHARDAAGVDSDVDLVVLSADPDTLIDHQDWLTLFGEVDDVELEDYGAARSLRVFYQDGLEVEFVLTTPTWAEVPLDAGTEQVISDGFRVLFDPEGLLGEALDAITH